MWGFCNPMTVRFVNPLPLVGNMAQAVSFYSAALGLKVAEDHGDFVRFEGPFGRDNLVLYFEADDLDEAFARVEGLARVIHPVMVQAWGGRVFRCRDLDGHIIEIGEA
jgi:predicted enzyme related to lactoylglutathione lyase